MKTHPSLLALGTLALLAFVVVVESRRFTDAEKCEAIINSCSFFSPPRHHFFSLFLRSAPYLDSLSTFFYCFQEASIPFRARYPDDAWTDARNRVFVFSS